MPGFAILESQFMGFTSLYAAAQGARVEVFEPSPGNGALLEANLAVNPRLAGRVRLHRYAVGARDARLPLYGKARADSGSSLFQTLTRRAVPFWETTPSLSPSARTESTAPTSSRSRRMAARSTSPAGARRGHSRSTTL